MLLQTKLTLVCPYFILSNFIYKKYYTCLLYSMLFNKILCNYCFPYLTTSPTCSEAGGVDDLVSLLIYIRKSSCVVLFKEPFKESLHGNYNIQRLSSQGGTRSLFESEARSDLSSSEFLIHPRIGCIIPNFNPPEYDLILGFSLHLDPMLRYQIRCSDVCYSHPMLG